MPPFAWCILSCLLACALRVQGVVPTGSVFPQKRKRQTTEGKRQTTEVVTPQTGWIFGAVMISQALVVVAILSLRKRRHSNLARADEGYEMKSHEDALT